MIDTVQYQILSETEIRNVKLRIIHKDLSGFRADILVSSDDNEISASGGVSKAIMDKAGIGVHYEISLNRRKKIAQGDIVATSGGALPCRTILHAIVLDKKDEVWRWPNSEIIKTLTHKCLDFAEHTCALSIAFPVLGGGTASKDLSPAVSLQSMVETIQAWCREQRRHRPNAIAICVYDLDALEGIDFRRLASPNQLAAL